MAILPTWPPTTVDYYALNTTTGTSRLLFSLPWPNIPAGHMEISEDGASLAISYLLSPSTINCQIEYRSMVSGTIVAGPFQGTGACGTGFSAVVAGGSSGVHSSRLTAQH